MILRPPRATPLYSSAASDVYKRQDRHRGAGVLLVGGAVRQADADLRVAVHGETGTVEAARAGAAVHVGDAEIALGDGDHGGVARAAGVGDGAAAAVAGAAGGGLNGRLGGGAGGRGLLLLKALDVVLDAGRHLLEAALHGEDFALLRGALGDELG